jgi:hypothetical protein
MKLLQKIWYLSLIYFLIPSPAYSQPPTITVDISKKYQTIIGWEITCQAGELDEIQGGFNPHFHQYEDFLFDQVAELGINRIRLDIHPDIENPRDYFTDFVTKRISMEAYTESWEMSHNDNSDPLEIDWKGFQFSSLDHKIETMVLPLRKRLAANNEILYVNLCLVDIGHPDTHFHQQEEYTEVVLAIFLHMHKKYGFVPDAVEVSLEPTVFNTFLPEDLGKILVLTGDRLKTNGFVPDFIAPSSVSMDEAIEYFREMIKTPRILDYWKEFSYHRYGGSFKDLQTIARLAKQHGLRTAMLEWWELENGYETLHEDLIVGQNASWEQAAFAFFQSDPYLGNVMNFFTIDDVSDPRSQTLRLNESSKFLQQYYKFIRRGAQRVEAVTTDPNFDPVAFMNKNHHLVVVVKTSEGGSFSMGRLPPGPYGISYTTFSEYNVLLPDVDVDASGLLETMIPEKGVITISQK